jgi:homoserine kinase
MAAAYATGAWGVTISGAGSGLLAITAAQDAPAIAAAMRDAFSDQGETGAVGWALRPDRTGLRTGEG